MNGRTQTMGMGKPVTGARCKYRDFIEKSVAWANGLGKSICP